MVFCPFGCDTRPTPDCFIRRNRGRRGWDVYKVVISSFGLVVTLNYFGIHLITLLPVSRSVLSPFSSISSMLYSSFLLGVILFISQWFSGSMSRRYLSRSLSLMSGCCFSMFSISCWCSPSLYSWVVYASRLVD